MLVSYKKSFLAYCTFVLQASEAAEAEQVNTPVNPDWEVQLIQQADLNNTNRDFLLLLHKYTVVCIELST